MPTLSQFKPLGPAPFEPGTFCLLLPSNYKVRVQSDRIEHARTIAQLLNTQLQDLHLNNYYKTVETSDGYLELSIDYYGIIGDFIINNEALSSILCSPRLRLYLDKKTESAILKSIFSNRIYDSPHVLKPNIYGIPHITQPTPPNILATLTAPSFPLFNIFYP